MTPTLDPGHPIVLHLNPTHKYLHPSKTLPIWPDQTMNIGRCIGTQETYPDHENGYYESPAMSRRHCIFFCSDEASDSDSYHSSDDEKRSMSEKSTISEKSSGGMRRKLYIQDLGTLNGTYLNGRRLGAEGHASIPTPVKDGDDLVFAHNLCLDGTLYTCVAVKVGIDG
jgi:pSer/pThr/pTyr-binding forkhead associated (FHA) protein